MNKVVLMTVLLVLLPCSLFAEVTKDEVKKLCSAGISDGVILSYLKAHGPMASISADDVLDLKRAGATDVVLAAIVSGPINDPLPPPSLFPEGTPSLVTSTFPSETPIYYPSSAFEPGVTTWAIPICTFPPLRLGFGCPNNRAFFHGSEAASFCRPGALWGARPPSFQNTTCTSGARGFSSYSGSRGASHCAGGHSSFGISSHGGHR